MAIVAVLTLAACAGSDDDSMASEATSAPAASVGALSADDAGSGATIAADAAEVAADPSGPFDIGIVGRDVIIEMHVVLSTDDIGRTVASIMAQASSLGGGIASSNVNYGRQADSGSDGGSAVLVVKVPPQSIDRLLAGLADTGTVQSINQSAQDVTEQLVDLDVRISNARQSVANVREFMDRTQNLNELVTLEGELTRRQTELERLEAQQRNLSERVALSTITIEVMPTAPAPEPIDEGSDTIGDALRTGWDAFTGFLFGIGFVLAVLLPFLAVAAIASTIGWQLMRRRNRRSAGDDQRGDPVDGISSADVEPANQSGPAPSR